MLKTTKLLCVSLVLMLMGVCEAQSYFDKGCGYIKEINETTIIIEKATLPKDPFEGLSPENLSEEEFAKILSEINQRTGEILEFPVEHVYIVEDLTNTTTWERNSSIKDLKPGDKIAFYYKGTKTMHIYKVSKDCIVSDSGVYTGIARGTGVDSNGKITSLSI